MKAEGGDEPEGNDLVEAVNAKVKSGMLFYGCIFLICFYKKKKKKKIEMEQDE